MTEVKPELRSCKPRQTQHATFEGQHATARATESQPNSLKAAALLVLQRNNARNSRATDTETERNFHATTQVTTRNSVIMDATEESAIRAWLAFIGERDTEIIDDVLGQCRAVANALAYFVLRSAEVPTAASADKELYE